MLGSTVDLVIFAKFYFLRVGQIRELDNLAKMAIISNSQKLPDLQYGNYDVDVNDFVTFYSDGGGSTRNSIDSCVVQTASNVAFLTE